MNSEIACFPPPATLETLRKPRRKRGGGQTKDPVGRTPTQHVHFSNLAITNEDFIGSERNISNRPTFSTADQARHKSVVSTGPYECTP